MDLVRSCYRVKMRLQEGADPVLVQWRVADRDADLIGVPTAFGSANWNIGEDLRFDSYLGEQAGARPWVNGQRPAGLIGKKLCFPLEWFTDGVPAGIVIDEPVGRDNVPSCCKQVSEAQGGVWVSGSSKVTVQPCDCFDLPDELTVTFTSLFRCNVIEGVTIATRVPGQCSWIGSEPANGGIANFSIEFDDGTWTFNIDCFLGPEQAFVTKDACSPLDLNFFLLDSQACCSFVFGSSYSVRVQS
jgi:hypothetical protein